MPLHSAAFKVGEYVRLQTAGRISQLQEKFVSHDALYCEPAMERHAGKLVVVVQNEWPIPGVAYRLEEVLDDGKQRGSILGIWCEDAIIDPGLLSECKDEPRLQLASEVYFARSSGSHMVEICDLNSRLFCSFRDDFAANAAEAVNGIAKRRCRGSFERFFQFDGDYSDFD